MKIDINVIGLVIVSAVIMTATAIWPYVSQFSHYDLSDDPEAWAQLGDYIGGTLNPIVSFASILLLVRSITLQRSANEALQSQILAAQRVELTRAFEAKFFGMLKVQSESFFGLAVEVPGGSVIRSADTVLWIEEQISNLRSGGATDVEVLAFLESLDKRDQLYGLLRGFYVTVKFIDDGLSNARGFSEFDRQRQIHDLINFTDFALVRFYKIMMQFYRAPSANYLNSCRDLLQVMKDVGLDSASY